MSTVPPRSRLGPCPEAIDPTGELMGRNSLIIPLIFIGTLAHASAAGGGRFELLSRTLLQAGPAAVEFLDGGVVVASGAALAVAPSAGALEDYRLLPLGGEIKGIATQGDHIYAAAWNLGIVTVDLSDPDNPAERGTIGLSETSSIAADSGMLIALVLRKGLYIYDLSDPARPEPADTLQIDPGAVSLGASDGTLAVFYKEKTVLYDIRGGTLKAKQQEVRTPGGTGTGYIARNTIFIFRRRGSTTIHDISGEGPPRKIGDMPVDGVTSICPGEGDSWLALTGEGDLFRFAVSKGKVEATAHFTVDSGSAGTETDSGKKELIAALKGRKRPDTVPGSAISVSSGMIVSYGPKEGAYIFRVEGDLLIPVSMIPNGGFAFDLVADGGWLYLADGSAGLRTGKVSADGQIDWRGHLETSEARDVALSGDLLLLADGRDGMKVIDISDPAKPVQIGSVPSPYFLSAVVTRGTFAFLAGGLGGAEVVDFSDPAEPRVVWRQDLSEVRGVFADEDHFYISDGFDGFHIYRINGGNPQLVTRYDTPGWNDDLFVSGDEIYLAEGGKGLYIADIKDRKRPVMLGSVDIGSIAREIHAFGTTVFVASNKKGITAVDVSDPKKPFIAARHRSADDARGVFADQDFVYLASGAGGVYIFRYIER